MSPFVHNAHFLSALAVASTGVFSRFVLFHLDFFRVLCYTELQTKIHPKGRLSPHEIRPSLNLDDIMAEASAAGSDNVPTILTQDDIDHLSCIVYMKFLTEGEYYEVV